MEHPFLPLAFLLPARLLAWAEACIFGAIGNDDAAESRAVTA